MVSMIRPKKRLACKLPPTPPPPPGPFKLFIRFPSDAEDEEDTRVHSITIESDSVAVTALKARIELLLGLPGKYKHIFFYSQKTSITIFFFSYACH